MKHFFKITPIKVIIAFSLIILELGLKFLYTQGIVIINNEPVYKGNIAIGLFNYIVKIIFLPIQPIRDITTHLNTVVPFFIQFIFFFIFYIGYAYIVGCAIASLVSRKKMGPNP